MLCVDIGATYLKFLFNGKIERIRMPSDNIISVEWIKQHILERLTNVKSIVFSCQMHGYVIGDKFMTWKNKGIIPKFIDSDFTLKTGLYLRNDLPISNLYRQIYEDSTLQNTTLRIKNISEALLDISFDCCSVEMQCGTGFYNIFEQKYIDEYIQAFKDEFGTTLLFDKIVSYNQISGYIKDVPCYPGCGDLQCALLGAGLNDEISINMATGSQVSILLSEPDRTLQTRPYFGKWLKCITHIPSGRLLLMFQKFIPFLFDILANISIEDLSTDTPTVVPDLFGKGVQILNIDESVSEKSLCIGLLKSYLKQYDDILLQFPQKQILLSGGIPKKIKLIQEYYNAKINSSDDDSLMGIFKLFSNLHE